MPLSAQDRRWLDAAAALSARARPSSRPNPAVGALIVRDGLVVGRGWTQPGGRPHAEAVALAQAGELAHGATLYVTLEPCAHGSARGPDCAGLVAASGLARVVVGCADPDPRTAGVGLDRLSAARIAVDLANSASAMASLAGYLTRARLGRPHTTLKLALSLDGCLALADGASRWITGEVARAHCHAQRARADAIVVGGGTLRTDQPRLDVRLPGLEERSPERWVLTRGDAPAGWRALARPEDVAGMAHHYLFVEGGAQTAAAFLAADLVDCLLIYRAPIVIGGGRPGVSDLGLGDLAAAHGRWVPGGSLALGKDRLEVYERSPCSPA